MVKERHKIKRRLAIISFVAILVTLAYVLFIPLPDNNAGVVSTIIVFLTSIIGGYLGLAYHDDYTDKKNGTP